MTNNQGHRSHLSPASYAGLLVLCSVAFWLACDGPPFPSYDPPPTFAIHYVLQSGGLLYPIQYSGSSLSGNHMADIGSSAYPTPSGNAYSFGPAWVGFGTYFVVQNGRWPAQWRIGSVAGCGANTYDYFYVTSKIVQVTCTPAQAPLQLSPNAYEGDAPPPAPAITLSMDPSAIPGGTPMTVFIVRASDGYVESSYSVTLSSQGTTRIDAPFLHDGDYWVAADFAPDPNGYDGASELLSIFGNPDCGYAGGEACW